MSKQIKLNETATMTSLEIAELTGKEHYDVLKSIRITLEAAEINAGDFSCVYNIAIPTLNTQNPLKLLTGI